MSKDKYFQLIFRSNEDVSAALLFSLRGNNIEDSDKQDIVTNISFEAIIP